LFASTSDQRSISQPSAIPTDPFFALVSSFTGHFFIISPRIGSGYCGRLNQTSCLYECWFVFALEWSTIDPYAPPPYNLPIVVVSADKERENARFAPERWERRYQKIGTANECMWKLDLVYDCSKYNQSNGGNSRRFILRPTFVFRILGTAAFLTIFQSIGSDDCQRLTQGTVSSKGLFFYTIIWSAIELLGATPNEPPYLLVSAGQNAVFALISSKTLGAKMVIDW